MRRPWRRLLAAAAISWLAASVACSPDTPSPPPPPPDAGAGAEPAPDAPPDLPAPPPGPALEPKPDARFSGKEQPPAGLPDDVPLYAPATPLGSMASPSRGTIVNLQTSDASAAVFDWYRDELGQRGWILDKQTAAGTQHLLTATKQGRKVSILIRSLVQGSTMILITVSQES
ncbi:MAG: hypothetical protein DCC71_18350 [Proteobacteria bacterium]|nr:MAG: hypothetical protein DCC71_18350 [Pseudomonadota bacterium]